MNQAPSLIIVFWIYELSIYVCGCCCCFFLRGVERVLFLVYIFLTEGYADMLEKLKLKINFSLFSISHKFKILNWRKLIKLWMMKKKSYSKCSKCNVRKRFDINDRITPENAVLRQHSHTNTQKINAGVSKIDDHVNRWKFNDCTHTHTEREKHTCMLSRGSTHTPSDRASEWVNEKKEINGILSA